MAALRKAFRAATPFVATAAAVLLLFAGVGRGDQVSGFERATAPLRQDLVRWEVAHIPDKWWSRASAFLLRRDTGTQAREAAITGFFELGEEVRRTESSLARALAAPASEPPSGQLQMELDSLEAQRRLLQPLAEEAMEGAITKALVDLGIIDSWGPVRWPPVDFTFEPGALLLVRSPRDEVRRLADVLLRSDVGLLTQAELERTIEADDPAVTALVVRVGGVATYPTQVSPSRSLHDTLILASHEWAHHWLTFRPLGQRWWAGGELTSINETLATIVGEEVGDVALALLTGEEFARQPWQPPAPREETVPDPDSFNLQRHMRETRVRLDDLLETGRVSEAEAWLEERRLGLMEHDIHIRRLNTAYFAFHGTYAADPRGGSVNPVDSQLRTLRMAAPDLASFVDMVAAITATGELEAMARAAGWTPASEAPG